MFDNTPGERGSSRLGRMAGQVSGQLPVDPVDDPPWDVLDEPDQRAQSPPRAGPARLVEHRAPGDGVPRLLLAAAKRRPIAVVGGLVLLVAVVTATSMLSTTPEPVAAPGLPAAALSSAPAAVASSAAAPAELIVSVVGKVARPGLVTLPAGARVADALRAAGGVRPGTRVVSLNLARRLADGEQIYVGIPVPRGASPAPPVPGAVPDAAQAGGTGVGGKLDLNTATAAQLEELPGIGEVTAQSILDWRTQHGRFTSIGQLDDVDGIGEVRFGRLKDLVVIR